MVARKIRGLRGQSTESLLHQGQEQRNDAHMSDTQGCCMDVTDPCVLRYAWLVYVRSPRGRGLLRIHRMVPDADYGLEMEICRSKSRVVGRMDPGTMDGEIEMEEEDCRAGIQNTFFVSVSSVVVELVVTVVTEVRG